MFASFIYTLPLTGRLAERCRGSVNILYMVQHSATLAHTLKKAVPLK
jgi:hypothetical protein